MRQRLTLPAIGAAAAFAMALATVVPAVTSAGAQPPSPGRSAAQEAGTGAVPAGCAAAPAPGHARCYLLVQPATVPESPASASTCPVNEAAGYSACNIQGAYGLKTLAKEDGARSTIAVVDAYNDPTAAADLTAYRTAERLPACTTATGCFRKVNQRGTEGTYPPGTATWGQETSLDLDMVSAVCPLCHILLVVANSSGFTDLETAVDEAVALGASVVSDSWGTGEFGGETGVDINWDHPGVPITFSSGDGAYTGGVQYPSASPYVTSVGGTVLTPASNARGWKESAWSTTGSGCSKYEQKPPWQKDKACAMRMTADVSAVAANVLSYDTYQENGWYYSFGTSVSSPIVAGLYGLAHNAPGRAVPASAIYTAPATDLHDIVSGSTGTCTPPTSDKYFCKALKGYDGPTGRGTPKGIGAFKVPTSTPPRISSVTFAGSASSPSVTVAGADFGAFAPVSQPAGCSTTGENYGPTGLNLGDTSAGWTAGANGDCIGLVLKSWSSTAITFSFGSGYISYGTLANGDTYTLEVQGVKAKGAVTDLTT